MRKVLGSNRSAACRPVPGNQVSLPNRIGRRGYSSISSSLGQIGYSWVRTPARGVPRSRWWPIVLLGVFVAIPPPVSRAQFVSRFHSALTHLPRSWKVGLSVRQTLVFAQLSLSKR